MKPRSQFAVPADPATASAIRALAHVRQMQRYLARRAKLLSASIVRGKGGEAFGWRASVIHTAARQGYVYVNRKASVSVALKRIAKPATMSESSQKEET